VAARPLGDDRPLDWQVQLCGEAAPVTRITLVRTRFGVATLKTTRWIVSRDPFKEMHFG
jgi:hypothetical protein